jgi:hypothetical protein
MKNWKCISCGKLDGEIINLSKEYATVKCKSCSKRYPVKYLKCKCPCCNESIITIKEIIFKHRKSYFFDVSCDSCNFNVIIKKNDNKIDDSTHVQEKLLRYKPQDVKPYKLTPPNEIHDEIVFQRKKWRPHPELKSQYKMNLKTNYY